VIFINWLKWLRGLADVAIALWAGVFKLNVFDSFVAASVSKIQFPGFGVSCTLLYEAIAGGAFFVNCFCSIKKRRGSETSSNRRQINKPASSQSLVGTARCLADYGLRQISYGAKVTNGGMIETP
jgi:hypothetical protein